MGKACGVRSSWAKKAPRTNSPKNDGCSGKDCGSWAYKTLFLVGCANTLNVVEHPILNKRNPDASKDSGNNVNGEHDAGRNFHIMPKLQVCSKVDSLVICHVSNCFEDHIGNWLPWKHVTSNKFEDHLCGDLLVADGYKNGERDR